MTEIKHVYEVRPRKHYRCIDLISDALPFGRVWYDGPNSAAHAVGYAKHRSRLHDAVIRVYDAAGNVLTRSLRGRRRYLPDLRPIAGKMSAYLFLISAN
jgi:hypothetical protein